MIDLYTNTVHKYQYYKVEVIADDLPQQSLSIFSPAKRSGQVDFEGLHSRSTRSIIQDGNTEYDSRVGSSFFTLTFTTMPLFLFYTTYTVVLTLVQLHTNNIIMSAESQFRGTW